MTPRPTRIVLQVFDLKLLNGACGQCGPRDALLHGVQWNAAQRGLQCGSGEGRRPRHVEEERRSRDSPSPLHSAGIYFLFGFILFGILFASLCSRLASFAACCAVCRAPFRCFVALLLMCVVGLL